MLHGCGAKRFGLYAGGEQEQHYTLRKSSKRYAEARLISDIHLQNLTSELIHCISSCFEEQFRSFSNAGVQAKARAKSKIRSLCCTYEALSVGCCCSLHNLQSTTKVITKIQKHEISISTISLGMHLGHSCWHSSRIHPIQ